MEDGSPTSMTPTSNDPTDGRTDNIFILRWRRQTDYKHHRFKNFRLSFVDKLFRVRILQFFVGVDSIDVTHFFLKNNNYRSSEHWAQKLIRKII